MELNDLTEQEKLKLANLLNPETEEETQYQLGPDIERDILAGMLLDRSFFVQVLNIISHRYFASHTRELICQILLKYFENYHILPTKQIMIHEVKEAAGKINKPQELFIAELQTIYSEHEPTIQNREWLLDQIENFAKVQALKLSYAKTIDILFGNSYDKWLKIFDLLKEPFKISRTKEHGLDYFHNIEAWFARQRQKKEGMEVFSTGFDTIDMCLGDGGGVKGELYGWLASSGVGKSLLLVKTAIANIIKGKKVLFISLEMDEDKVSKRFHSQLAKVDIHNILFHEKDVVNTMKGIVSDLKEQYPQVEEGKFLIIKQFPAGMLDVNGLRAFMSQLANDGFKPEVLIVDYVGEMKDFAGMPLHESRQRLNRDLRALGVELGCVVWTALQPNRAGKEAQKGFSVLSDDNIGDSYGQIRVFDGLWGINQDVSEKAVHIARLANIKLRDGRSSMGFPIFICPVTLQISQISDDEYKLRRAAFRDKKMPEINIDSGWKPNPVKNY